MRSSVTNAEARAAREAKELVDFLRRKEHKLETKELTFVWDMRQRLNKYGDATFISFNQLEWLRSLAQKCGMEFDETPTEPTTTEGKVLSTSERHPQ